MISITDRLSVGASDLPAPLQRSVAGVPFSVFVLVEAARLDHIADSDVLSWLGVAESAFEKAEESFSDDVMEALAEIDGFDAVYEDLIGRALELWPRAIEPLDSEIEMWMAYQQHALASADPASFSASLGLTAGDEIRLGRLWRVRLQSDDLATNVLGLLADAPTSNVTQLKARVKAAPLSFPPMKEPR